MAVESKKKGKGMSRSKHKHKQERKRRHERQILEGTRKAREKIKKKTYWRPVRRVKLSEVNREDVIQILEIVRNLKLYP